MIEGLIQALRLISDAVYELANSGDINERDADDARAFLWEATELLNAISQDLCKLQQDQQSIP